MYLKYKQSIQVNWTQILYFAIWNEKTLKVKSQFFRRSNVLSNYLKETTNGCQKKKSICLNKTFNLVPAVKI